jgi:hypothetical protein
MASGDDVKTEQSILRPEGTETSTSVVRRYEAPCILRKRSLVGATLQVISGGCNPDTGIGCGVGGH